MTLKMDVSYTEHSHVIGKGGNNIKKVMQETGCHIHFPDSNRNNQAEKSNQVRGLLYLVVRAFSGRFSVKKVNVQDDSAVVVLHLHKYSVLFGLLGFGHGLKCIALSNYYFAKFLQSIVLTQVFGVRACVRACLSVIVSNNFLLHSITKTILPGSSPHLLRTFRVSIPSFLLILGSFRKTRWPPCLFFYSIFSH